MSRNVNDPILKGLCKFQADIPIIARFTAVQSLKKLFLTLIGLGFLNAAPKWLKQLNCNLEQPPVQLWIFQCKVLQHDLGADAVFCLDFVFFTAWKCVAC